MAKNLPAKNKNKGVVTQNAEEVEHNIKGYSYLAGGKVEPDGWSAQKFGNENGIVTETIDFFQDNEKAWAKVRATDPKTGQFVEDVVQFIFIDVFNKKVVDLVDASIKKAPRGATKTPLIKDLKNPLLMDKDMNIEANLTPRGQLHIIKQMVSFKYFAIRTAQTDAARRAILKILNKEWREDEEIKEEKKDRDFVNNRIQEENEKHRDEDAVKKAKLKKEKEQKLADEKKKEQSKTKEKEKKEENAKQEGKEKSKSVNKTESTEQKEKPTKPKPPKDEVPSGIDPKTVQEGEVTPKTKEKKKKKNKDKTEEGDSRWKGLNGKQIVDLIRKTKKTDDEELKSGQIKMEIFNLHKGKLITKGQYQDSMQFIKDISA